MNKQLNKIVQFAEDLEAEFHIHTSCGLARPCIGLIKGGSFISYNPLYDENTLQPYTMESPEDEYEYIPQLYCAEFDNVKPPNAYHKFDCVAVLLSHATNFESLLYEKAIEELYDWVTQLEKIGVDLVRYKVRKDFFNSQKEEDVFSLKKK